MNLRFTINSFPDNKVHFLDLSIDRNITNLYKDTGQYISCDSFVSCRYKTAWIKELYSRALKICSNTTLSLQNIVKLTKLMSCNGFPQRIRNSITHRLNNSAKRPCNQHNNKQRYKK